MVNCKNVFFSFEDILYKIFTNFRKLGLKEEKYSYIDLIVDLNENIIIIL